MPGGDNSIQNFGEEADTGERAAAEATLSAFEKARVGHDYAVECAQLAKTTLAPLEQFAASNPKLKGRGCPTIIAAFTNGGSVTGDALTQGVASLRVEGDRGFALYHGPGGADYFIPMVKEDGEWKVGAIAPSEFPG